MVCPLGLRIFPFAHSSKCKGLETPFNFSLKGKAVKLQGVGEQFYFRAESSYAHLTRSHRSRETLNEDGVFSSVTVKEGKG